MSAVCPYRCTGTTAVTACPASGEPAFRCSVNVALRLEIFPQLFWIHVVCALIDIHENGPRAGLRNRFRRRDERVRYRDNDIARLARPQP